METWGLPGFRRAAMESFRWQDILRIDFSLQRDNLCVWDFLRWNPILPVPDWRIRITTKHPSPEENTSDFSQSLGCLTKAEIRELSRLFSAYCPDGAAAWTEFGQAGASPHKS